LVKTEVFKEKTTEGGGGDLKLRSSKRGQQRDVRVKINRVPPGVLERGEERRRPGDF